MSRAHINSILSLKDVIIPIDSNSSLWHFDKHMYSTDALKASHNTADIKSYGKFDSCVHIQEATTNLWNQTTPYIYNNYGVPASLTTLSETYLGRPVFRLSMTVDDAHSSALAGFRSERWSHGVFGSYRTYLANTKYAVSIYWRPINKTDVVVDGTASNIGGWNDRGTIPVGGGWYKTYACRTGGVATDKLDNVFWSFFCPSLQLNEPILIDWTCPQIEEGIDYATPYTFAQIPNQLLAYNIKASPSTISCYFKLSTNENRGISDREILWYYDVDDAGNMFSSNSYWHVYVSGQDVYLFCKNAQDALADKTIIVYNSSVNIFDNQWHYLCIRFDNLYMTLTVDSTTVTTGTPWGTAPRFKPQKLGVACAIDGIANPTSKSSNIYVDELRLDNLLYSIEETQAWRFSNKPYYDPYDYTITAE